MKNEDKK